MKKTFIAAVAVITLATAVPVAAISGTGSDTTGIEELQRIGVLRLMRQGLQPFKTTAAANLAGCDSLELLVTEKPKFELACRRAQKTEKVLDILLNQIDMGIKELLYN